MVLSDCYQPYEALRVRHWQRPPQGGVCRVKNGSVGADTERQSQHSNGREPRILRQHPQSVARIIGQISQPSPAPNVLRHFHH